MLFNLIKKNNNEFENEDLLYDKLFKNISSYIKDENILSKINKCFYLAKEKHKNQKRITGENFIIHPISVAQILADLKSEPNTLMASLLHDVLEDTDLTYKELKEIVGRDVADIVLKTTKLSKLVFNRKQRQIENQQNMFLAMAKDIRVILVKICDRLHNMKTLQKIRPDKQIRISQETLSIYVPLTHRLGLFSIKYQLEDLAFRYTNPKEYYYISNLIKMKKNEREISINNIIKNIKKLFYKSNINNFSIAGRSKNIYSIFKKMNQRKLDFTEIFDLLAVRIIVDKVELCYHCLGIIHAHYSPLPLRFKDYIAIPKSNLYQSLHNTVLSKDGLLFEIQIRTKEMDEIAENGIAAHWGYKENKIYSKETKQLEIVNKLRWYKELIKITEESENYFNKNSENFVDAIKNDILSQNVYVFTPKQEVLEFPSGSTLIDFAFRIHSDLGYKITNGFVNGKIVPINYKLKNGDLISVKTNSNILRVKKEWFDIVKTSYAKKLIKRFLNKQKQEQMSLSEIGKEIFHKKLLFSKIEFKLDNNFININFNKIGIKNINDFYEAIANKKININNVIDKIKNLKKIKNNNFLLPDKIKNFKKKNIQNQIDIFIEDRRNIRTKLELANCCSPVRGEEIVGFITKEKGVRIHKKECPNLKKFDNDKIINSYWNNYSQSKYSSWICIIAKYDSFLVNEIIKKLNFLRIDVLKIKCFQNYESSEIIIRLQVSLSNIIEMKQIFFSLSKIKNIYQIYRGIN
ncbi:RelA/SpoT family protein [Texas Phoenix palm phytoplasma]|uniref:RelA/SpoT family protein n=1 Tax=Texas Phoenix palm phytoplasma TaxID=176709 RepID=A0ABS5BIW5_9MOLU|nr:RelA/SpoT family protein [Texas Phoenix palm phytoplasma]MBP3059521.1 RelA/SpoT family protein [Texas Phoenix palm phytoplasma]